MSPQRIDYYDSPDAPKANSLVPSVNVVVVNDAGEILLIRRTDNGNWAVPGGAIDLGESVAQAAVRETLEESGIECAITGIVGIYSDPRHVILYTSNGEARQEFSIVLTARPLSGQLTPGSESSDVRWVSPSELPGYAMDQSMRIRINDFLARKETPVRAESEYVRCGTLAYLAAYDVHRARVFGRCEPSTGIKPFTALVDQVMRTEPYASAKRVFWVVDNGASHRNWAAAARLSLMPSPTPPDGPACPRPRILAQPDRGLFLYRPAQAHGQRDRPGAGQLHGAGWHGDLERDRERPPGNSGVLCDRDGAFHGGLRGLRLHR